MRSLDQVSPIPYAVMPMPSAVQSRVQPDSAAGVNAVPARRVPRRLSARPVADSAYQQSCVQRRSIRDVQQIFVRERYGVVVQVSLFDTERPPVIAMSAATTIIQAIRAALRGRRMTYRELAAAIGVSEPTVKRDLSRGDFSLSRLDRMCDVLELSLEDLAQNPVPGSSLLTQLSERQERALVRDPRMLVVTYLVVNDWKWSEVTSAFQLDDDALVALLLRLDQLGIVDYRPPRRIRKLTARNFSWRKDGPIHEFFLDRVAPEFLRSRFDAPTDELRFIGGMLSDGSLTQMKAAIGRLAQEFDEHARRDARLCIAAKNGCSMLLAMRQWEFSEFTRLRRKS